MRSLEGNSADPPGAQAAPGAGRGAAAVAARGRGVRRFAPRALLIAAALVLAAAAPAPAAPPNDNYLASTTINGAGGTLPPVYGDKQDTSTATVQANLFDFDRNGAPLNENGGPELTSCGPTSYGKTVWYDFVMPTAGGVRIVAAGFDTVVRVYEWNPSTTQITRSLGCHNASSGTTEGVDMQRQLRARGHYTVQVGGVNGAGGPLDFGLTFFPDTDGDTILDEAPDRCRTVRGISAAAGCPPLVSAAPRIRAVPGGGGVRVLSLAVDRLSKGAKLRVSCSRCGRSVTVTARRSGSVQLRGFAGRQVRNGDTVALRITQPRSSSGRYRFGAIGRVFRWRVTADRFRARQDSCLAPNSTRRRMPCP